MKKYLLFSLFIITTFFLYAEDVYYFKLDTTKNKIPIHLTDPRIIQSFYFCSAEFCVLGVTSITTTAINKIDSYEQNVINLVENLCFESIKLIYLGRFSVPEQPKELKDILKKDYESYIDPQITFLKTDRDKKLFSLKVYDHIIKDKDGKIIKIEYVTSTVKEE